MSSRTTKILLLTSSIALLISMTAQIPAYAGDGQGACNHCKIDYTRLELTPDQSSKIQTLDREWHDKLAQIKPSIVENQQKVKKLMASPQSEATEIMMVQQKIDDLQGELKRFAAQILIKKKECLNTSQKERLEQMIKEEIQRRQQEKGGVQSSAAPQRWQKLIRGVEGIFNPDSK